MAPFSADTLVALQHVSPCHDAAADSGAEDDAEYHLRTHARTVGGLGEREAIRVVHHTDRPLYHRFEVLVERVAV